jgi:hypothetical protein
MSMDVVTFTNRTVQAVRHHKWYANRATELSAIASALNPDTITHDTTKKTAISGLRPGHRLNSAFTNHVLRHVNAGKAGNLSNLAMSNAITSELSKVLAPTNITPPVISGTGVVGDVLSSTVGTWNYVPTSYRRQWRRGANNIAGATGTTYTLVAADSGTNITMSLVAINGAGESAPVISNSIAVA